MLGYELEDINRMQFYLNIASSYLPPNQQEVMNGLKEIHSFFDGLWAEGYFD